MRICWKIAGWLGALALAAACGGSPPDGDEPLIGLFEDLGSHRRPITTDSELAQRYFDQGLNLSYAFNHDTAVSSFEEAARLDPDCAICFWGMALALGPNINAPMGPEAGIRAHAAAQRAQALAPAAREVERDLIAAVALRYSADPEADRASLDRIYAEAMREVQRRHPDDLDVATLTAEALMDLSPWDYWTGDAEPRAQTPQVLALLEGVMERDPQHPGANHYYIHAVEEFFPERAVPAAERLVGIAPDAGHLVHMPSHIFWRVGRYEEALEINQRAAAADEAFFGWCRAAGLYRIVYYPHNIHFLWAAAVAEGRSDLALSSARNLASKVPDSMIEEFAGAEEWRAIPLFTMARFGHWDAIRGEPQPAPAHRYTTGAWHYARGLASVRQARLDEAATELAALQAIAESEALASLDFVGEPAADYLRIGAHHLAGELAAARGEVDAAVAELEQAVRIQDAQIYTEPPRWYFPLRQALGAVLLDAGRAEQAEAVYRLDLAQHPRNGWSLYGLARSLREQGRDPEAAAIETGFTNAWERADIKLAASRF